MQAGELTTAALCKCDGLDPGVVPRVERKAAVRALNAIADRADAGRDRAAACGKWSRATLLRAASRAASTPTPAKKAAAAGATAAATPAATPTTTAVVAVAAAGDGTGEASPPPGPAQQLLARKESHPRAVASAMETPPSSADEGGDAEEHTQEHTGSDAEHAEGNGDGREAKRRDSDVVNPMLGFDKEHTELRRKSLRKATPRRSQAKAAAEMQEVD